MPEEVIEQYGLHRTSRERLSILLELEQEFSVWDQAKRELKHLPYFERLLSQEIPLAPPLVALKEENNSDVPSWIQSKERLHERFPFFIMPLEARAWAALETYRHKKWKLHWTHRRRLRTPSSGRTQGLTYAIPEHLGRPPDHILYKAWFDPYWRKPKRQEVPWIEFLLKYPRRRSNDNSQ